MRGIATIVTGTMVVSALLVAGVPVVEALVDILESSEAATDAGFVDWSSTLETVLLRWLPALWIIFLLAWATAWTIRRGRTTGVQQP